MRTKAETVRDHRDGGEPTDDHDIRPFDKPRRRREHATDVDDADRDQPRRRSLRDRD